MKSRKNRVLSRTGGALCETARSVEIMSLCVQLRHAAMDSGGREGGETDREIQYQIQERAREEKRGE